MKYKIIPEDTIKNLIEFLDEIQFEAAKVNSTEAHHQVNFCNWAINELINSYNVRTTKDFRKSKDDKKKPNKKSRDQFIDETFMDWELPEMSDEEFEKLVDNFDNFLRSWEKEYNKKNPKKKQTKRKPTFRPHIDDIVEYMSLDEIQEYLLDDEDLTTEEAFDLYYDEHKRVQKEKERKEYKSLNQILKDLGIDPTEKN